MRVWSRLIVIALALAPSLAQGQATCVGDLCPGGSGGPYISITQVDVSGNIIGGNTGLSPLTAVKAATAAVLPNAPSYSNGALGAGATLVSTANAALVIDGYSPVFGDRILVANQALAYQNGIYVVTSAGSVSSKYQLSRATDADTGDKVYHGVSTYATNGIVNGGASYILTTGGIISPGNTSQTWSRFTSGTPSGSALSAASFIPTGAAVPSNGLYLPSNPGPYVLGTVGMSDAGVNIFAYGPNTPTIDDGYQNGLPPQLALTRNSGILQTYHDIHQNIIFNDQIAPSSSTSYVAVVGGAGDTNFTTGDTAAITPVWRDTTFGAAGSATIGCTVNSDSGTYPNCNHNVNSYTGTSARTIIAGLAFQVNRATSEGINKAQTAFMAGRVFFDAQDTPTDNFNGCGANCYGLNYLATRSSVAAGGFGIGGNGTHPGFYKTVPPAGNGSLDGVGFLNYRQRPSAAPSPVQSTVTVTIANPAVITWTGHGLTAEQPVYFRTTGALPTGLAVNTAYYVIAAGLTANSFEVSATIDGAAVITSGGQSGTQTALAGWQQQVNDNLYEFDVIGSTGNLAAGWSVDLDDASTNAGRILFTYGGVQNLRLADGISLDVDGTSFNGLGTLTFPLTGGEYWGTTYSLTQVGGALQFGTATPTHITAGQTTTPAASSCGTSPVVTPGSSDVAGEVTMGTGSPTGCIITFNVAYVTRPFCSVTWEATPLASQSYVYTKTAITLTQTATSSNAAVWHCIGQAGG